MSLAIAMLPKILRPVGGEIEGDVVVEQGFDGLIPTIMKEGNCVYYPFETGNFQLTDFYKLYGYK